MTAIDINELSAEVAISEMYQLSQRSRRGVSMGNRDLRSRAMQNLYLKSAVYGKALARQEQTLDQV